MVSRGRRTKGRGARRKRGKRVYLDIETTCLSPRHGSITMVGLFRPPHDFVPLVAGKDLHRGTLRKELDGVKELVTFNGKRFDVPWIAHHLGIDIREMEDIEHVDLMYVCRRHGLRGGQKNIELELGLSRDVEGVDGRVAARLGKRWLELRDREALDRLVGYNKEDCMNLWRIHRVVMAMEAEGE